MFLVFVIDVSRLVDLLLAVDLVSLFASDRCIFIVVILLVNRKDRFVRFSVYFASRRVLFVFWRLNVG